MFKKPAILIVLAFCLPLLACSGGESPQPEPSEVSTEPGLPTITLAPTLTPEPEISGATQVTSIDQLAGTWIAAADQGNFVATIELDGTFRVATSVEDLEKGSTDSWKLSIEEGQISATGFAMCLGDTGSYLAVINEDGTLKFTSIIDPCEPRLRKMDRSLPGRLTEYILVFYPVK